MTRTERTYYLVCALYNGSWSCLAAVYALFLLDRGLDLFEINLVLATFLLGTFLFEVPTGAIADVFDRKRSFLLSCLVRAAAFALYYRAAALPVFLAAELLDSIGNALASGALDAWAVDGMRAEGSRRRGDHFFARSRMVASAALIVGGCSGAYLAQTDLARPWLAGAGGFLLTFVAAAALMERDRPERGAAGRGWRQVLRASGGSVRVQIAASVGLVARHPSLRAICCLNFVCAFAQMPVVHYWQPHLLARAGGQTWVMGWVWALLSIAALAGSALAGRLSGRVPRGSLLASSTLARAVAVLVAAWSARFAPAVAGVVGQAAGNGAAEPLLASWMNDHAEPAQRATVLSLYAMSFTAGGGLGLLVLGYFARTHGIAAVWSVSALLFAVCAALFASGREADAVAAGGAERLDDRAAVGA